MCSTAAGSLALGDATSGSLAQARAAGVEASALAEAEARLRLGQT